MSKSTKANTEKQENQPLIAKCFLCGYRTPVSSHEDPILISFCPICGGFLLDTEGNVTYLASMEVVDNYEQDDEWLYYLNQSKKQKKKTKKQIKEPTRNEPQEWSWLKYTYFKDKEDFKKTMKWVIAFFVFIILVSILCELAQ
ncbi:MAG: hypothetical protein IK117_06340 [Bacteroidales bacterium]|nr:hypothetical protein [Bacteroidales bacterium]